MVSPQRAQPESAERRLNELGIELTPAPTPFGAYVESVQTGNLLYLSGMVPAVGHEPRFVGRLRERVRCRTRPRGGAISSADRGSFLRSSEDSLTGTISLVPQTVDAVEIPVIAAGGIADARGIAAAFALGAEGVQIGTAFLACEESGAHPLHREAILSGKAGRTSLTLGLTGRLARGIHNELLESLNRPGTEVFPYPLQRALMRSVAFPAQKASRSELLALWAGQSANLARCGGVDELLASLVEGAAERIDATP